MLTILPRKKRRILKVFLMLLLQITVVVMILAVCDSCKDFFSQFSSSAGPVIIPVVRYPKVEVQLGNLSRYFRPALLEYDRSAMLKTMEVFTKTLDNANMTYIMFGTTLLGSLRHMGPAPWDDGLRVIMDTDDEEKAKLVLSRLRPNYGWQWLGDERKLRFFQEDKLATKRKEWRWPFVDVGFYDQNSTHIWEDSYHQRSYNFKKIDVFPLKRRPFDYLWPLAPRHPMATLTNFDITKCTSKNKSHKAGLSSGTVVTIDCSILHTVYPFVRREKMGNGQVREVLTLRRNTLKTFITE
ncbi:uncharacterized protein LOC135483024 [Lineus longissimus]|uniref:uncharacterized protein LOC135483024 n=1 Tax=Lineus longissimus TaxID=88925 RepID=UPI00315DFAEE